MTWGYEPGNDYDYIITVDYDEIEDEVLNNDGDINDDMDDSWINTDDDDNNDSIQNDDDDNEIIKMTMWWQLWIWWW